LQEEIGIEGEREGERKMGRERKEMKVVRVIGRERDNEGYGEMDEGGERKYNGEQGKSNKTRQGENEERKERDGRRKRT
jgi:hypothetical protein